MKRLTLFFILLVTLALLWSYQDADVLKGILMTIGLYLMAAKRRLRPGFEQTISLFGAVGLHLCMAYSMMLWPYHPVAFGLGLVCLIPALQGVNAAEFTSKIPRAKVVWWVVVALTVGPAIWLTLLIVR